MTELTQEQEYIIEESLVDLLADPESALFIYKQQITEEMLLSSEKYGSRVLRYVYEFISEHRQPPSTDIVKEEFPEISFEPPRHPAAYTVAKIKERWARNQVNDTLKVIARAASSDAGAAAKHGFHEFARIQSLSSDRSNVIDAYEDWPESLNRYHKNVIEGSLAGYTFGFPEVDRVFIGIRGLVFFLARPGRKKTWMMLHSAHAASMRGANVVFLSLEMPNQEIMERWECLATDTSFSRRVAGRWTPDDLRKYEERIQDVLEERRGNLHIIYPDIKNRTVAELQEMVKGFDADVVYIDQFKFLKYPHKTNARHEQAEFICEELKDWANHTPIAVAAQFNREAVAKGSKKEIGDASTVGISDAIPQTADLLVGNFESKEMTQSNMFRFASVKTRNVQPGAWIMGAEFREGCRIQLLNEASDDTDD